MSSTDCELHAPRRLAHPHRRHRRDRVERRAVDEHELDVAGEAAATEAPAVADAIVRHAPFHGSLQAGQRPGRQGIDTFGDAALRLRQAGDVGEDRLVADRRLRGACPAGHGLRQRRGDFALCLRALGRFRAAGSEVLSALRAGMVGTPWGVAMTSRSSPNELDRLPDPRFQVGVAVDALGLDDHPALHRPAGDVEHSDMGLLQRCFGLFGPDACDQRVLEDADEQLAVKQKTQPAEHLLLGDTGLTRQGVAYAGCQGFAEGHGRAPGSRSRS